ncbi:MAG: hypothetical protein ACI4BD_07895 [Paludibacteraceae bacterium]
MIQRVQSFYLWAVVVLGRVAVLFSTFAVSSYGKYQLCIVDAVFLMVVGGD